MPPLAAVALGWAARGARPDRRAGAVALFMLAWVAKTSLVGEAAAALLSALSCVTLGVLLAAVTPPGWLKVGIVLMAGADTWLVVSDLLQAPNATLVRGAPAAACRSSRASCSAASRWATATCSWRRCSAPCSRPTAPAVAGGACSRWIAAAFDLLFLVLSELPATVPVALALVSRRCGSAPPPDAACAARAHRP